MIKQAAVLIILLLRSCAMLARGAAVRAALAAELWR